MSIHRRTLLTAILTSPFLRSLVLIGNVAGGALFGLFLSTLSPHLHIVDSAAFGAIARKLLDVPWWPAKSHADRSNRSARTAASASSTAWQHAA